MNRHFGGCAATTLSMKARKSRRMVLGGMLVHVAPSLPPAQRRARVFRAARTRRHAAPPVLARAAAWSRVGRPPDACGARPASAGAAPNGYTLPNASSLVGALFGAAAFPLHRARRSRKPAEGCGSGGRGEAAGDQARWARGEAALRRWGSANRIGRVGVQRCRQRFRQTELIGGGMTECLRLREHRMRDRTARAATRTASPAARLAGLVLRNRLSARIFGGKGGVRVALGRRWLIGVRTRQRWWKSGRVRTRPAGRARPPAARPPGAACHPSIAAASSRWKWWVPISRRGEYRPRS
jgi:hypothetical protein